MKKLNTVSVVYIDGSFRVTYSYDELDESGAPVAQNKRGSFDADGQEVQGFLDYVSKIAAES